MLQSLHLQDTYNFLVSEDISRRSTVGTVFADDTDLGVNGIIQFLLLEDDSGFFHLTTTRVSSPPGVQRFAGLLINLEVCISEIECYLHLIVSHVYHVWYPIQNLDYESETSYSLVIQAINTAFPGYESAINITVTVRDTNDNTPRFSMPNGYLLSVSEAALVGTPVGTVVATDNDGGLNGTVSF